MFSEPHRGSFIFTPFRVCKNHDLAGSRIHLEQWSNTGPGSFPQGTLGWGSCPPLTKLGQRVKKQDWRERKFGRSALLKVNINPITLWDWTRGQSSQILHSFCEEALFPNLDGQQHFLLTHPWGVRWKFLGLAFENPGRPDYALLQQFVPCGVCHLRPCSSHPRARSLFPIASDLCRRRGWISWAVGTEWIPRPSLVFRQVFSHLSSKKIKRIKRGSGNKNLAKYACQNPSLNNRPS